MRLWDGPDDLDRDIVRDGQKYTIWFKTECPWTVTVLSGQQGGPGEFMLVFDPNSPGLQAVAIDPDPGTGNKRP